MSNKISDNQSPSLLLVEGAAPAVAPSGTYPGIPSGTQRLFIDTTDHTPKRVDHSGTVTTLGGGGGALTKVATITVTGSVAATIDFTAIPAGGRNLLLTGAIKGDGSGSGVAVNLRMNADSGSTYNWSFVHFTGGVAVESKASAATALQLTDLMVGSSSGAHDVCGFQARIVEYANTAWFKQLKGSASLMDSVNGNYYGNETYGDWMSTAVITELTLIPASGNFAIGSTVTLWMES